MVHSFCADARPARVPPALPAPWRCRARRLTDEQRSAIANYFAVYRGQEKGVAKLALALEDHPAVARAYGLLRDTFEQVRGRPADVGVDR